MWGLLEECVLLLMSFLDNAGYSALGGSSVLAHPIRRTALCFLIDEPQMTRRELAEKIADEVNDVSVTDRDTLEVVLHHNHLPRLHDERYVEYDPRNGDVVLWKDPEAVDRQLSNYK